MIRKLAVTLIRVLPVLSLLAFMLGTTPTTSLAAKPPTKTPTPTGGPTATSIPSGNTITVSGTPWGVSTCYIGATEGNVRFNVADLQDAGLNTYRVYGGMSRWERQDDDGVYGSPTIDQIKANPSVINWTWWDNIMTTPPDGSDYHWSGEPGTTWQGNARTIFADLKAAGIRPVLTVRNVDNNIEPAWAETNLNPPNTPEDWNEWWEHVFATAYWLNVRNDYRVDDYEIHNEPNNQGQGFNGTIEDYYQFVIYTNDAIQYVYSTYLPGRTPRVYAPVSNSTSWPRDVMINVGDHFTVVDYHNYSGNILSGNQTMHGHMNANGFANAELWLSEWATYRGGYNNASTGVKTIINNLIRGSQPANDHIDGSHLFTFYDWNGFNGGFQNFEGLVDENGVKRASFYATRPGTRALQGCKTTYQSTTSNSNLLAITTRDTGGHIYLLVTNSAASTSYTVDANLSALITSGTGTMWQFDSTHLDVIVGNPVLNNGHVTFTIPGTSAILIKY